MNILSQTKRGREARQWRANKREKRRFNVFLSDFTNVKFGNVYKECKDFFDSLNEKYPNKHDLTKTKDYKRWKNQLLNDSESESAKSDKPEAAEQDRAEPEAAEQDRAEPEAAEQDRAEPEAAEPSDNEADNEAANQAEPPLPSDIIQIASSDLIPDSPEMDLDIRIYEIIRELQQDDDLKELMNAERNGELVQPHYMDEDEGIGLNVDMELQAIIEPFDFQLEVEEAEW